MEERDATRRTRLANERTYLAWWRTGLTAFAVSIGAGKVVPAVASGRTWPYVVIGIAFAAFGVFCSVYAYQRHREVEDALTRDEYAPPDERAIAIVSGAAAVLGLLLIVVLALES